MDDALSRSREYVSRWDSDKSKYANYHILLMEGLIGHIEEMERENEIWRRSYDELRDFVRGVSHNCQQITKELPVNPTQSSSERQI
jgi:hypothetical protein